MVNLTLFGGVSLERDGRPVAGPAAQRRRLGLLALLGAAPPAGFTREKLIGYLWPDVSSEQARRFLADSIYTLRKALGQDAIIGAGDTLRLNPDVVRCDVLEFRACLARHDDEAAVALRGGPFLDGFYVPDAPEIERWSETERADLDRAYSGCLDRLAVRAQERGDHGAAVRWWQTLQTIDSMSSPVAVRLAGALERAGDPAGALRVLQEHEATLREELGIAPDAAVTALADRLRAAPAAVPVRPPPEPAAAARQAAPPVAAGAVPTPAPSEKETPSAPHGSRPFRRAPIRWAAAVAVGALAAVMGIAALVWATADRGPPRVVVETFENRTGDAALEPLGAMAADWIARSLIAVEGVQVVSPAWADSGHAVGSPFSGRSARGDARVSGAYYRAAGGLRFEARLVDPVAGRLLQGFEPVLVPADSGVLALDLIRERVAAAVAARSGDVVRREITARLQPPTYPAYLEYLEGLRLFARFQSAQAAARFERAAALDTTFDLARLFGVLMALNTGRRAHADSLLRPVVVRRERMPAFDRALLEALESDLVGDRLGVLRAMRRVSAATPASQFTLGHAVAAIAANRAAEARELLRAVDPDAGLLREYPRYWEWLTTSRHLLGEHRAELREAREARRRHPELNATMLQEIRALAALGRMRELSALLDDAERAHAMGSVFPAEAMHLAASELRAHGHAAEAARVSARGLEWLDGRPADDQLPWLALRVRLLGEAGRWEEAARFLDDLVAQFPGNIAHVGRRGVVAARLGDAAAAREAEARLGGLPAVQRSELALWRARIAAQSGRTGEAVALLRGAFAQGLSHGLWLHTDADLAVLRSERDWDALLSAREQLPLASGS